MRAAPVLLALATLVVSGCFGAPTQQGPSSSLGSKPVLPAMAFNAPVDLNCRAEDPVTQVQDTAFMRSCGGFGEPVIEVAGDGTVWASATCCVGRSPPIWVSRDHGVSFHQLPFADRTGVVRDAFGIEGDFAMDDVGNVFFFDIAAASTYFTKYLADGTHVFTKPDAFLPVVDRPWVRAGVADEVWVFYNTATATNLYHSTNGGLTWSLQPTTFNCGLMTFGQGPVRNRLFVAGCTDVPKLWLSTDGGTTFAQPITLPVPDLGFPASELRNGSVKDPFMPPVSDEAGNVYVPFVYATDRDDRTQGIFLDVLHADGRITGPTQLSAPGTWNEKPWPAAAGPGQVAVAWYSTNQTRKDAATAEWNLTVAHSLTAASENPVFARSHPDPDPVLKGDFGRTLGDFLQSDIGPDGRYYVIYATADGRPLVNRVVISADALFAPGVPHNGPKTA